MAFYQREMPLRSWKAVTGDIEGSIASLQRQLGKSGSILMYENATQLAMVMVGNDPDQNGTSIDIMVGKPPRLELEAIHHAAKR